MNSSNPYAPPQATVHDVTDPNAGMDLADRGTRLGAAILDGIILGTMVYLPLALAFLLSALENNADISPAAAVPLLLGLAGFIAWCWITIRLVNGNGQSIAKKLLGIKVVRRDGSRASLGRIFWLRNVVNGLLGIVPLYSLVDPLFIFGEPRQCLHDKIADTIVIRA